MFGNIFPKIVNFIVTFYWTFCADRNDLAGLMFFKESTNTFELFFLLWRFKVQRIDNVNTGWGKNTYQIYRDKKGNGKKRS